MKAFKQKYTINATKRKVWNALVNPKIINKWGGGPSKMTDEVGFRFSLWKGTIFGKNIKVEKNKLLVQEWYGGRWDEPSIVTFEISEEEGVTTLKLLHEKVPDEEEKDIKKGWKDYYLNPLKDLVENS
jgi:activator of HSP90 ATPase